MTTKRKIEVFSAGCSVCQETIKMVKGMSTKEYYERY